jgi:hypothetical protein
MVGSDGSVLTYVIDFPDDDVTFSFAGQGQAWAAEAVAEGDLGGVGGPEHAVSRTPSNTRGAMAARCGCAFDVVEVSDLILIFLCLAVPAEVRQLSYGLDDRYEPGYSAAAE